MGDKKYISITGIDYTEFVKTDKDIAIFNKMVEAEKRTVDVPFKECYADVMIVLKLGRILKGGDPNTIVMAKSVTEGLAKIQAFSKTNQN
jgi:ABC-type enterochelin transport system ATPase subunit